MNIKIDVKDLKEIIDILLTMVSEAKFEFSKTGLQIKVVDPAHVAMITLKMKKEDFREYDVPDDTEIGIDLEKFKDFLKAAKTSDIVELIKEDSKITINLNYLTRTMSTIDPSSITVPKVPQINLSNYVVISTEEFLDGLKVAESISDNITLHVTMDEFMLYSTGEEDQTKLNIPKENLKEFNVTSEAKSVYPVDYLLRFMKTISSENVKVYVGTDYPVKIEFTFASDKGEGMFLLAPRIEG
ncbi:MAG: DNA polymerase sliding clamp [Thermoplasmata archaeon]